MPQLPPEKTARFRLPSSASSLQGRFVVLLVLMGMVSIGSWVVTAQVEAELNGFAKQIDVAGSLRYRMLQFAERREGTSRQAFADTQRLMQAQAGVLDQLIAGDPAIGLRACGSPLICTRLREHKRRLPTVVQAGADTDVASGLPAPIVDELASLDVTVHEIATEAQARVDRVALTARVSALSTLLLLGLVGVGVWTVFRRIRTLGAAASHDSSEVLTRLAAGEDEVGRLAKVLVSSIEQMQRSSQSERERARSMERLQASAKTLAVSLDAWLSTDAVQPMVLAGLVESLSVSGAWVDRRGANGKFELVACENVERAQWASVVDERYEATTSYAEPLAFSLDTTSAHTAVVPLGFQDEQIGHLGLTAAGPVELTPEQNAAVETMVQYLSVSLLAQRLLAERRHREAIAASLAVITDLEHSGAAIGRHLRALVSHDVMEIAVLGETGKVDAVWRVDEHGSVARAAPVFLEVPREPLESPLDPAFPLLKDSQAHWVLLVPLTAGDRVEGVAAFGRQRERYRPREVDAAVAVAPLLATAVARMRLEEQLKLSEQFTALGGVSRMLAHEVRNPLNVLSLNAELVRRKLRKLPIPAEQQAALAEHLQLLRDEVARLEAMVSDFVSLAAGDVAQSADAVDLRDLVSAVLDVHAPNFEERGIALHVETGDDPVVVRVHSLRIQQVLHNLMTNALDALAGKDERSVRVSIQRKSQSVEVRVRDTGPGLADTNIVFSPTYSTKAGGGGMGLAISRQIARLHSGFLGAEKSADGGAEFVLSLPLAS